MANLYEKWNQFFFNAIKRFWVEEMKRFLQFRHSSAKKDSLSLSDPSQHGSIATFLPCAHETAQFDLAKSFHMLCAHFPQETTLLLTFHRRFVLRIGFHVNGRIVDCKRRDFPFLRIHLTLNCVNVVRVQRRFDGDWGRSAPIIV